jgi:hypothetical protein
MSRAAISASQMEQDLHSCPVHNERLHLFENSQAATRLVTGNIRNTSELTHD